MKSKDQQAALSLHRTRDLLVKQRTPLVNMMRALLAEFGIDIPEGSERAFKLARRIAAKEAVPDVPATALPILDLLCDHVLNIHARLQTIDRSILILQRSDDVARRLSTIPGIGPVGATALAASVADPKQFRSGREFAAWLWLTPSRNSSGGKDRLGRITKMGDRYLRKLLVVGATSLKIAADDDVACESLFRSLARRHRGDAVDLHRELQSETDSGRFGLLPWMGGAGRPVQLQLIMHGIRGGRCRR